jgi:hypothetical protein
MHNIDILTDTIRAHQSLCNPLALFVSKIYGFCRRSMKSANHSHECFDSGEAGIVEQCVHLSLQNDELMERPIEPHVVVTAIKR